MADAKIGKHYWVVGRDGRFEDEAAVRHAMHLCRGSLDGLRASIHTFLKRRAKAQRGLEPPRPYVSLPLFTKCVEGESSEVRPNAAREMKTARIVQGARVSVPYRRRHPRSSITGVLIVDCQNIGE